MIELVEKNGWKATEMDNYDYHKWAKEVWLMESVWSPVGVKAYVASPYHPISYFDKPYVWAIEVFDETFISKKEETDSTFTEKEIFRFVEEKNSLTVSLNQWKNEKQIFLDFLKEIRNNSQQK